MDSVTGLIRFRPEPTETWQKWLPGTVTGFLHGIPVIFRWVPAGHGVFSAGFRQKIYRVLRQASSTWVVVSQYVGEAQMSGETMSQIRLQSRSTASNSCKRNFRLMKVSSDSTLYRKVAEGGVFFFLT
jgi:hypothetical protein